MSYQFLKNLPYAEPRKAARALVLVSLLDQLIFKHKVDPEQLRFAGFQMHQLLPTGGAILLRTERLNHLMRTVIRSARHNGDLLRLDQWLQYWDVIVTRGIELQVDDTKDRSRLVDADDLIELVSANVPEVVSILKIVDPKTSTFAATLLEPFSLDRSPQRSTREINQDRNRKARTLFIITAQRPNVSPLVSVLSNPPKEEAIAAIFLIDRSVQSSVTGQLLEAAMDQLQLGFAAAIHLNDRHEIDQLHEILLQRINDSEGLAFYLSRLYGIMFSHVSSGEESRQRLEPYIYAQPGFSGDFLTDPREHVNRQMEDALLAIGITALSNDALANAWRGIGRSDPFFEEVKDRYVQVDLFDALEVTSVSRLYPRTQYVVNVFVDRWVTGTATGGIALDEQGLSFKEGPVVLDVSLTPLYMSDDATFAPGQSGTITLPQWGRSSSFRFNIKTPAELRLFRARLVVAYRSAILQTLILALEPIAGDASLGVPFRLVVESNLVNDAITARPDDAQFDLTMVLNDNFSGDDGVTLTDGNGVFFTEPPGWRAFCAATQNLLSELTQAEKIPPSLKDTTFVNYIRRIAIQGADALEQLRRQAPSFDSASARYIQVVEAVNGSSVPVELFYDGDAPEPNAPICMVLATLKPGNCMTACPHKDRSAVICPMAFWGMHKQIERHKHLESPTYIPGPGRARIMVPPRGTIKQISLKVAMLATSNRVLPKDYAIVKNALTSNFPELISAHTWKEWTTNVANRQPRLQVLLPHSDTHVDIPEQLALEIDNSWLLHAYVRAKHLRAEGGAAPIVLMIGCETGESTTHEFMNFAGAFYAHGAMLVLASISAIHGSHASALAASLVEDIAAQQLMVPRDFGSILLSIKQRMFSQDNVLGLALVAYGDTTWELGNE